MRSRWIANEGAALTLALALSAPGFAALPPTPPVLSEGSVVLKTLAGAESHLYLLPLAAGECGTASIEQLGIDVVAQVSNLNGELVAEYDSESRRRGREILRVTAESATSYQLKVKARYLR